MITVLELIALLQALPPEAEVFAAQANDERAFRIGEPYLTTDGDVVLSIGGMFIYDFQEVE